MVYKPLYHAQEIATNVFWLFQLQNGFNNISYYTSASWIWDDYLSSHIQHASVGLFTFPYFSVGFSSLVRFHRTPTILVCRGEGNLGRVSKLRTEESGSGEAAAPPLNVPWLGPPR